MVSVCIFGLAPISSIHETDMSSRSISNCSVVSKSSKIAPQEQLLECIREQIVNVSCYFEDDDKKGNMRNCRFHRSFINTERCAETDSATRRDTNKRTDDQNQDVSKDLAIVSNETPKR